MKTKLRRVDWVAEAYGTPGVPSYAVTLGDYSETEDMLIRERVLNPMQAAAEGFDLAKITGAMYSDAAKGADVLTAQLADANAQIAAAEAENATLQKQLAEATASPLVAGPQITPVPEPVTLGAETA